LSTTQSASTASSLQAPDRREEKVDAPLDGTDVADDVEHVVEDGGAERVARVAREPRRPRPRRGATAVRRRFIVLLPS